jgi:hypothetical protein
MFDSLTVMPNSRYLSRWIALLAPAFCSVTVAAIPCPTMPDMTQINRDVKSRIDTDIGSLGKLKAAEISVRTDVVAKNLFKDYRNSDRLLLVQMMSATYCAMIRDNGAVPEQDKLALWDHFQNNAFKFLASDYVPNIAEKNPTVDNAQARQSVPTAPDKKPARVLDAPPTKDSAMAPMSSKHWITADPAFPPSHISFRAYGMSVPLVLVYGNHTKHPMLVRPYYISTDYLPIGVVNEFAKSHPMIGEVSSLGNRKAVCQIFRSDLQAIADDLGFEIPRLNDWVNAFEAGVIAPRGQRELALLPGGANGEHDLLGDIGVLRSGESANTRLSGRVSFFVFPEMGEGAEEPKGCVRILISQDKLKQLFRAANPG